MLVGVDLAVCFKSLKHVIPFDPVILLLGIYPCDTVICKKKYIFGLHPISGTGLLKLIEFPKW